MEPFNDALECDRTSAFGSIIGLNRKVTIQTANTIREAAKEGIKVEAIIAPSYNEQALKAPVSCEGSVESWQRGSCHGTRICQAGAPCNRRTAASRSETGTRLAQEELKVVSKRAPTDAEIESLLFAWKACKHVKSNCILYWRKLPRLSGSAPDR